ncbi:MAG: aminopeptidase P N-terminal domain-containing protein [Deltaproteobacteria bacterium]|nr:aminopeptidase P N-terminal domain-containing protein [Deltaproteobacteria bacterium]
MDRVGPKGAVILPAAPMSVRSNDVDYTYRADNDLLYLTGFSEPEAVCLLLPGHPSEEYVLFVSPRDPERETWTGRRAGVEGATARFGAQTAYAVDKLDEKVGELVSQREHLYFRFGRDSALNHRVVGWMQQWQRLRPRSGKGPIALFDPAEILHEMRLRKSREEIALMRRAVEIATEAHVKAMHSARDGMHEFEIEALIDSTFRKHGANGPAYPSIIAGGVNATILHYTANDQPLRAGDLLLIDAGAEYQNYCSDITRTFPVNGCFSREQRSLYEIVLAAQLAAIHAIRPGARFDEPHNRAVDVLVDGLMKLGLMSGDRKQMIEKEEYKPFYMHRTSHWLGMDVHDVGQYKSGDTVRVLEEGMVLTVEPGIYVPAEHAASDPKFRGIGIRIEDDVLVTAEGCSILSSTVPKDPKDLESVCGHA